MRRKLPFGIAQIGKAFRNEITPGNFTFRTREFEQMEIEYFVQAGRGRGGAPGLDRRAHAVVRRPRHAAREPAPARAGEGRAGALRQALRRPRVQVPHGVERARGDRQPHRLRSQGAQPQPGEPRRGRRAASTSTRSRRSTSSPTSSSRRPAPTARRWRSCATRTTSRWSRSRPPRRSTKLRELVQSFAKSVDRSAKALDPETKARLVAAAEKIAAGLPGTLPRLLALSDDADANRIEVFKKVRGVSEKLGEEFTRTVLRLHPRLAPITVAVFPLKKNEPRLVELARGMKKRPAGGRPAGRLRRHRRHRQAVPPPGRDRHPVLHHRRLPEPGRQDRHVRDRDTMAQERVGAASWAARCAQGRIVG